jgi:hypothetical protein
MRRNSLGWLLSAPLGLAAQEQGDRLPLDGDLDAPVHMRIWGRRRNNFFRYRNFAA